MNTGVVPMTKGLHCPETDRLFEAILRLGSVEECYELFDDLCTVKEIRDMSQRLEAACLLSRGLSYREVAEATGMSPATVGRVKRCLEYGSGGYVRAIARMEEAEK